MTNGRQSGRASRKRQLT